MEERKYIDRLYQEKFKDFEAAPRQDLWKNIASQLKEDQKKKKPLLSPFWTSIAGVAAVLAMIMLLGDWLTQPLQPSVVTGKDKISRTPNSSSEVAATNDMENVKQQSASEEFGFTLNSVRRISDLLSDISTLDLSGIEIGSEDNEERAQPNPKRDRATAEKTRSLKEEVLKGSFEENPIASTPRERKLEISTHAAPIYYGNLKQGNFLDEKFNSNTSEGEVTYSYGINITYKVSDKLKIRSGISKVSMSHNTNNIALQTVLDPRYISAIDLRGNLGVRVVNGAITGKGSSDPLIAAVRSSSRNNGLLNQKLGFIEVPVEVEYALVDERFAIHLIGGASTLFLDENSISISSGPFDTVLGEANNLNNVSFSTNIGLGFDYKLSEKFKLNLEPMFKYQINTFDAATGTYQPYYIGIYSGFSYKF